MITKYYAEEGDTVEVGAQFLEVDTDAKAPEGGATPAPAAPEPTPAVSVNFFSNLWRRSAQPFVNYLIIIHALIYNRRLRLQPPQSQPRHPRQQLLPHQQAPLLKKQQVQALASRPPKRLQLRLLAPASKPELK